MRRRVIRSLPESGNPSSFRTLDVVSVKLPVSDSLCLLFVSNMYLSALHLPVSSALYTIC